VVKILLLYIVPITLMVYALIDCATDEDVERTSVPKALWMVLIILLPYIGSIAWIVVSKASRPDARRDRPGRPGPVAPDDDPDFLRRLDEESRRRRREQGQGGAGPDAPPTA
jgi:hypothetical protein